MTLDLFDQWPERPPVTLGPQARHLPGHLLPSIDAVLAALDGVLAQAPLRQMVTPGGRPMSVRTTSAGDVGWITDRLGYRYAARDPVTGRPWPAMPDVWRALARTAAGTAGFDGYEPDSVLVNEYAPGARMSLHQDRDEIDERAPIVSVSLGLPATFLWGGMTRQAPTRRIGLLHGDVVVWGGVDRLRFHGVLPVADGEHPLLGRRRINLTFRRAR